MVSNSSYRDIMVVCESRDGRLTKTTLEVLTKARELGDQLGARVEALVLGTELDGIGEQAIPAGADIVLIAEHETLTTGNIDAYFAAALPVIKERKPEILLMSANSLGLDLAPRLAAALGTGALSDATKLDVDENDRLLVAKRLTYDGSVEAAATIPRHRPQIASLRPGAVRPGFPDDMRYGNVERVEVNVPKGALKVELVALEDAEPAEPPLKGAEIVVAGGLGLGEDGMKNVQVLAQALGGAWGAEQAAVQFEGAPAERHIGATGEHVAPRLYIGAGVSGDFDHYYAIRGADVIVGIHEDKAAPIFRYAQYGLVGDAKKIVPKILEQLKRE